MKDFLSKSVLYFGGASGVVSRVVWAAFPIARRSEKRFGKKFDRFNGKRSKLVFIRTPFPMYTPCAVFSLRKRSLTLVKGRQTSRQVKMNAMFDYVAVSSELDSWSDEELVFEYRTFGNERCFEEIVRRYRLVLARYLSKQFGLVPCQIEEALQATFARVIEKISQFDPSRRFRPWIYRIAYSQTINIFYRGSARIKQVSFDEVSSSETPSRANELEGDAPDPAEIAERKDFERRLHDAVRRLPSSYREVVEIVFFEGMTYVAAARVLNLASTTVARRLRRALEMTRNFLVAERLDVLANAPLALTNSAG